MSSCAEHFQSDGAPYFQSGVTDTKTKRSFCPAHYFLVTRHMDLRCIRTLSICMGMEFWLCELFPRSNDLDIGILVDTAVFKVLSPT